MKFEPAGGDFSKVANRNSNANRTNKQTLLFLLVKLKFFSIYLFKMKSRLFDELF